MKIFLDCESSPRFIGIPITEAKTKVIYGYFPKSKLLPYPSPESKLCNSAPPLRKFLKMAPSAPKKGLKTWPYWKIATHLVLSPKMARYLVLTKIRFFKIPFSGRFRRVVRKTFLEGVNFFKKASNLVFACLNFPKIGKNFPKNVSKPIFCNRTPSLSGSCAIVPPLKRMKCRHI